MTRRTTALLLCLTGYADVAHADPPVELEVLGQITVHTEVEPTAEGEQIVRGRLSDEVGKPVAGRLAVRTEKGRPVSTEVCPWIEPAERTAEEQPRPLPQGVVDVGPEGEFCFLTEVASGLVLRADADHFIEATHDLDVGTGRLLTRPRFVQAPSTIDLHESVPLVVEVLGRTERKPPALAQLALGLKCTQSHPIEEAALGKTRLVRFEFEAPAQIVPGNCRFVATASAPRKKPLRATRSVLVRDRVELVTASETQKGEVVQLSVLANGSERGIGEGNLGEGLVEARENGAFVALAPVHKGKAELELEAGSIEREVALIYVPASAAYLPGEALIYSVPARAAGFQWASLHTMGLLLFAAWLGYAWLRPRHGARKPSDQAPPKRAMVEETGKRNGPITGKVLDAHTGTPLPGTRLTLKAVGPESARELESVTSDASGLFRFETRLEDHALIKLEASVSGYMSLHSATRSASVSVHLTHRRRAAVAQLVNWAKKMGKPWHRPGARSAPTPGSIEATATGRRDEATADWAREVAQAAYAPHPPSEQQVEALRKPPSGTETPTS